jgi:peroxiredoxin
VLYEKFHSDDVVFISLTSDNYETTRQFRDTHGIKFKVVSMNREDRVQFAAGSLPTNILVGIDGKIVLRMRGGRDNQVRDRFSSAILSELSKL